MPSVFFCQGHRSPKGQRCPKLSFGEYRYEGEGWLCENSHRHPKETATCDFIQGNALHKKEER